MEKTLSNPSDLLLHIQHEMRIDAPAAIVFETILEQSGRGFTTPDGKTMDMRLEPFPGGRWFRDLGNNTGHLWGHVQVIKPPTLLELSGPMFMSYPAISHIQYRLTEKDGATTLNFSHRAFGEITPEHREGVGKGWNYILGEIKKRSMR